MKKPLVLSKPAGLPCFPFHKNPEKDCLLYRLLEQYPAQREQDWPEGFSGGIAHRLDIPTSGQILVALDREHLMEIRSLFAEKRMLKTYYFLSGKEPKWTDNTISLPIAHDRRKARRMVVQRGKNTPKKGKWLPAETHFTLMGSQSGIHLWRAKMRSGVMHQIRIHAAFIGIGLLGDRLYGGGEKAEYFPSLFALHHYGIQYSEWNTQPIPLPRWWPKWTKKLVLD